MGPTFMGPTSSAAATLTSAAALEATTDNGSLATWRVLLVAGCALEQKLSAGLLARHGYPVRVAATLSDVVQQTARQDLDVLLIDGSLPESEYIEVVQAIRAREESNPGQPRIAILVLADECDESLQGSLAAGADGLLTKPLNIALFAEQVGGAVRRQLEITRGDGHSEAADEQVDWSAAFAAVDGQRQLLHDLIAIFMTEYPQTLAEIRAAIEQQDARSLNVSAHRLKGCLRYFGCTRAGCLAKELEERGKRGQLAGCATLCDEMTAALSRFVPRLLAGP